MCVVRACYTRSHDGLSLFSIPRDSDRAELWLKAAHREDLLSKHVNELHKNYKMCELHFKPEYMSKGDLRKTLFMQAHPTIFPYNKHLQSAYEPLKLDDLKKITMEDHNYGKNPMEHPHTIYLKEEHSDCVTEDNSEMDYSEPIYFKEELSDYDNQDDSEISAKMEPILLIHGGAGDIPDSRNAGKIEGLKKSMAIGFKILKEGGSALDAVEQAVRYMEDDENFNAGYGSVLNLDGEVEMDASVMVGSTLSAGAVTVVKDIKNPVSLARLVMEKTPHVLLAAEGASRFARKHGVPSADPKSLISPDAKKALAEFLRKGGDLTEIGHQNPGDVGTVGAVALDCHGNLAAATSTGGINGKLVGRCSDTSVIGSGTYADDDFGAVSTTGHGDTIMKYCLAICIVKDIEYGKSAQAATEDNLKRMTKRLNNTAGAITLSKNGEPGIYFTSQKMAWMYQKGNELHYGICTNEHNIETLK